SILIGLGLLFFPKSTKSLRRVWAIASISLLSVAMSISFDIFWQQITGNSIYRYLWSWISDKNIVFKVVLITTIGVLVMIYSDSYMSHDQGYVRFFAYLSLFTASMLGLVLSPNLIQIYFFWELVGMCSYLLIGDFGLLLGILGFYWITGSFEFEALFERFNELLANNEVNLWFAIPCVLLLFLGPVAKSAQFPLHVWLPDAKEGPTPIFALIHAATMVAAGIFLVARLFPLFQALPLVMGVISWTGATTALLGATIALAQRDIKKGLAYSTMSQLGYMMLALGIGSYKAALLFLGSRSIIHSMEPIVGYSPGKSQNMAFMGTTFLIGTLSLCGIPPFACFWSKDEILADSWLYFPVIGWIAWITAGLTAFYMFRIYFITFEGNFKANSFKESFLVSGVTTSKELDRKEKRPIPLFADSRINMERDDARARYSLYPKESDKIMLFPLLVLAVPTLFSGFIGVPTLQGQLNPDPLSHWLYPLINGPYEVISKENWLKFLSNAIASVGYIDGYYDIIFVGGIRILAKIGFFLDEWVIDGAVNGVGISILFGGENLKQMEGGRIPSYLFGLIFGTFLLSLIVFFTF
ncbi:hypothetical protein CY35_20G013900, partial [Sphagnum magellanicum]